jgi:hypothetical protein
VPEEGCYEVEKNVGGYGNEDQPARFASLLKSKTGKTWHYNVRAA